MQPEQFREVYDPMFAPRGRDKASPLYGWRPQSTYIRHALRLVYSRGLDLSDPNMATPIGRVVTVDANSSTAMPYPVE